jgi:hypothetical protein
MIYRVTVTGQLLGQVINNVLAFDDQIGGSPNQQDAAFAAKRVSDQWAADIIPALSAQYVLTGAVARTLGLAGTQGDHATSTAGGQAGDPYSSAIAAKVNILTGIRGRSFRGRTGIAGLLETQVSGNTYVEASRSDMQVRFNRFVATLKTAPAAGSGVPLFLGVISEEFARVKRAAPIFTPAVATNVLPVVGTRVSRLR